MPFISLHVMASSPEQVSELAHQWIQAKKQVSDLRLSWQEEKQKLQQQQQLYKVEKKALKEQLKLTHQDATDVDKQKHKLLSQQQDLEVQAQVWEQESSAFSEKLLYIWDRLPVPLQRQLEHEKKQIVHRKSSLSERYRSMLTVIKQLHQFQKIISLTDHKIQIGSQSYVVEALYTGIHQAWFITPDHQKVGYGVATEQGWIWRFTPQYKADIQKAFAMFKQQHEVDLVGLPIITQVKEESDDEISL
tara:strand:- start:7499 stop:8239 length:741 start_codon:yes stop_codon:yes gene_type:complete